MSKLPTSRLPVTPAKTTTNTAKSGLRPPQSTSNNATNTSQQISPSGGDSANNSFSIGDRVTANGKSGTVAFIGTTKFAEGDWMGVILDETQGKNDGSYEGTRYFETEPNRGLFCRPAKVQRLAQNGASSNTTDTTSGSVKPLTTPLPDASKASATATNNLDKGDANTTLVNTPPPTDANTSVNEPSSSAELRVGDRVVVSGTKFGTLKYLGKIHVAEGIWCGIQLDEAMGKNDGSVSGKRYFTCQQRYGLFSPLARVEKVTNEMTQSQIIARKASVSSSTNNNRPLHRSNSQESLQSNLSEYSASSNSISRIPTRTPGKIQQQQQQKLASNANMYTTPNTKSLLTQAAATLAAVAPSSNQIPQLVQALREKDIYIEKLQTQSEQHRLEFSRAAQQADEMESRMLATKQQYDIKEAENEQLKKEQHQTQQRIEDLEFQLEEYKLTDAHKEHSIPTSIPEGHRLLAPKDIEIYEEIKQKVLELETVNQKLILEKQTLQDEHRQELKRQSELNENEQKSRLNELEQKYTNNQMGATDAIKSEYEKQLHDKDEHTKNLLEQKQQELDQLKNQLADLQTTQGKTLSEKETLYEQSVKEIEQIRTQLTTLQQEKDAKEKQINDLSVELKRHQETLVPELEKQCQTLKSEITEFQNRDRSASTTVDELQSQYDQQMKEYQTSIKQALEDTDKVRAELKQFQEEKDAKEKQINDLSVELKRHQETLVPELEKQCQTLRSELTEFQNRDRSASATVNELQTQYEQQIKEYQSNIKQALEDTDKVRAELKRFQEENLQKEKQTNETINALKEGNEKLQSELNHRELQANSTLNEREAQYEQQVKDYQSKLEQTTQTLKTLQSELTTLQEEKNAKEKIIDTLKHDYEKLQAQLQDQDRSQTTLFNERVSQFETQIKEFQTKADQASQEIQELRKALEEKTSQEKQLNESLRSSKQDYEQQILTLKTLITELETQNQTKSTEFSAKDQQIQEHQTKVDQLNQVNNELRQKIEESQAKINQFQREIAEKQNTQLESTEQVTTLRSELQQWQGKYADLQTEYQQHLTSNEQLKNTTDNVVNEKQAAIDQLTKEITAMQQVQAELVEKQIKQHADFEEQEKVLKEKIQTYEKQIQLMKSEFLLETENNKLAYEQEKLRLTKALQETNNQDSSTATTNVKQLEYELSEARYQIEKLKKQVESNATQDDRESLESQISFLNDVIVDLRNKNEAAAKEIQFLKNPFNAEEEFSQTVNTRMKSSAPRLYCDMCEVFDQHDTDDCPKQSSLVDDQPPLEHQSRDRVIPPPRQYCEKCEEFGHDCNEADETY